MHCLILWSFGLNFNCNPACRWVVYRIIPSNRPLVKIRLRCKYCANLAFCWCFKVDLGSCNYFSTHLRVSEKEPELSQSRRRCKLRWSPSLVCFFFTALHQFVSSVSSARGTRNDLGALVCAYTTGTVLEVSVWRSLYGQKSKGCPPASSVYTAGLETCGRAVIPSPLDASLGLSVHRDQLKERGQCQQIALQDVVSAGYRAACENCGTKQPTPQQKKTTDLSKKILFWFTERCLTQQIIAKLFWLFSSY